jgi:SAM-dependent methyltransferase
MDFDQGALQAVREGRLLIDRYDAWLFEEFKPYLGRRIIEIGCGLGNLTRHFLDCDLAVGIDTSDHSVAEVQRRYAGHANVEAFDLSITDPQVLALMEKRFDTAVSLNVFEHIEDDELALRHTWHLLQPGAGTLILIVPAHPWLYGTMDRSIGHYRRYTKSTLGRKLERLGFRVLHQKYINALGALGWLVNGRILRRTVPPTGQLQTFNALVPSLQRLESLLPPPFGISLLAIAKKVGTT